MADDTDTLAFRVSTENLNGAIEILRALGGLEAYPEAYQVLILERSNRELQTAPTEIRLQRKTFEALPRDVQQRSDVANAVGSSFYQLRVRAVQR